ncbi:gamma-glutamyltransferase [Gammaproteobacteria bacterium]|nr:gamma-glutamyltransferase [Gammaproteobacteria bacterium]MDC0466931.1 gamma-glutamyltransferase [Gammaproteobacteria bacterium]MDC3225726.1 gamma-glutamyltransferase [Gammaproteobacteria bacterium]
MRSNLCIQYYNYFQQLALSTFVFFICTTNILAQSYEPIGTINPNNYEPAQKNIALGKNGMVTTQHFLATAVGEKILNSGGNAYDAAIAVGFTLAVVLPRAGNIGGGGFMVIHDSTLNKQFSIDYREKAPIKSDKDMYLNSDGTFNNQKLSTFGYLASGVPGTVAGLWEVHSKFGSLEWSKLLEDAIYYAENGFYITPYLSDMLVKYESKLSFYQETKKIFQKNNQDFKNKKLVQKDLAKTLKLIAQYGRDGFYLGSVAEKIHTQMQLNGGLITKDDLENYQPVWRIPLKSTYRDTEIITMGPPSSGGVHVIQMLNILENHNVSKIEHNSSEYINLLTEIMKYAYADRSKYLGDPDYYKVPVSQIISKNYAKAINEKIKVGKVTPSSVIYPGTFSDNESYETTHFSIVDKDGNAVSSTYTLNSTFGSGVVIKDTGILMNNEMDDFAAAPGIPNQFGLLGAEANQIVPGKRPLSSMTPTIVMKDGDFFFTTGSPGGSRIITAVLQSIINIVDYGMNLEEANAAKRIHHQWQPDLLQIESSIDPEIKNQLLELKYNIKIINPATCLQTIMYKDNMYYGYGDFRRPDAFASGEIYD